MKQLIRLMLLISMVLGIIIFTSCGDDDTPAPVNPTISLDASASDATQGMEVSFKGTLTAPEGLASISSSPDGVTISGITIGSTEEQDFIVTYTVPSEATIGSTIAIDLRVEDDLSQESNSVTYTITVVDAVAPTVAFKDFEDGGETSFDQGSTNSIVFTVSKDPLVSYGTLNITKVVNGGGSVTATSDISGETGTEITYMLSIDEEFLDEVSYGFSITDGLGNESEQIRLDADILTTTGATFLIDDFTVNGNDVKRIRGDIDENTTLMSANDYYLEGSVRVDEGTTVTIQAGTRVYAESGKEVEFRIEGMIDAQGTAMNPIVMTSGAALEGGTQKGEDWVGLRVNGSPGVSSGTIQYVRVEYGGFDNAAIRLNEVDALTTVSHIQSWRSGGTGFVIRGGTVNVSNLVVTDAVGVSIELRSDDTDYIGNMQFIIVENTDVIGKSGRDFEMRRGGTDGVVISNLTMIGAGKNAGTNADGDDLNAMRIGDSEPYKIYNSLIAEYSNDGIRIDYDVPGYDIGANIIDFCYIFQIGDDPTRDDQDPDSMSLPFETDAGTYSNVIDADNTPAAAAGIGVSNFVPDATITSSFDPTTLSNFFQAGSYVGAIGASDWTTGWVLNADGSTR